MDDDGYRDPDSSLARHIYARGARQAIFNDPGAALQTSLLQDFLALLRVALDDERVEPDVAQRVVERVIYGACPQPAMVEMRLRERAEWAQILANTSTRPPIP